MDTLPFLELVDADVATQCSSAFAIRIQKIWEDRNQFEEAVQYLLNEYEQNKPRDIFY
jgi:hypothetical protein